MTDRSHLRFGADPYSLDDLTAERLVRGLAPEDAPPLYRGAAEALAALRAAPSAAELAGEAEVVAGMAAVIDTIPNDQRRPRMLSRFLSAKIVAAGAAGLLSLGGVAAAATGSLPSPLQQTVANLASPVVHLPGADESTTVGTSTTSTTEVTTTTVAALTTAGATGADPTTTTTLKPGSPEACAAATNHGEFVSAVARDHSTTGRDHGKAVSEAAHSDCGKEHTTTTLGPQSSTTPTTAVSSRDDSEEKDAEAKDAPDQDSSESDGSSVSPSTGSSTGGTTTTAPSAPASHGHDHGSGGR